MSRKPLPSAVLWALSCAGGLLALILFLPVALGILAAAGLDPWIRRMQARAGMGRGFSAWVCVTGALASAAGVLWILGRVLLRELQQLSLQLPAVLETAAGYGAALSRYLSVLGQNLPGGIGDAFRSWTENLTSGSGSLAAGIYDRIFALVSGLLSALPGALFFLMTMVLSCYFAAAELPRLRELAKLHLPERLLDPVRRISGGLRRAVLGWLRAQAALMGVTFLILLTGFLLLRTDSPLLLALGVAVLDALPVFGTGTVLIPWAMVAMMTGEFPLGLGLLLLYGTAALTRNVLEPKLLGAQMGMSPLIALGAVYAGWRIGGIWGMLLLPVLVMTGLTLYRGFRQTAPAGEIPRSQRTFTVKYPEK